MSYPLERRIISGPSKWDFSIALFDGNASQRRPVAFFIDSDEQYWITINGVVRADGSGDCWTFLGRGYRRQDDRKVELIMSGGYNTHTRKGTLVIEGEAS